MIKLVRLILALVILAACLLAPHSTAAEGGWEPPIPKPMPEMPEQPLITYEVTTPSPDDHVVMTITNFSTIQVTFRGITVQNDYSFEEAYHAIALAEAVDIANLAPRYGVTHIRNEVLDTITIFQGNAKKSITVAETSGRKTTPQHLVNLLTYLRKTAIEAGRNNEQDKTIQLPELSWTEGHSTDYMITFAGNGMSFLAFLQIQSDGAVYYRNFAWPGIIQTSLVLTPELRAKLGQLIKESDFFNYDESSYQPDPSMRPVGMPTEGTEYIATITQNGRTRALSEYAFPLVMTELYETLHEIFDPHNLYPPYGQDLLLDLRVGYSNSNYWTMKISSTGQIFLDFQYFSQLSQQELDQVVAMFDSSEWRSLQDSYTLNPETEHNPYTSITTNLAGQSKEVLAESGADVPPALDHILANLTALYERTQTANLTSFGISLVGMPRSGHPESPYLGPLFVAFISILVGLCVRRKTTRANPQFEIRNPK